MYAHASLQVPIVSISARVTAQSTNAYYYGSSSFGWNYPIWSSISFNNQQENPYALQVIDDYAHCGIVASQSYTSFLMCKARSETTAQRTTWKSACSRPALQTAAAAT